VHAGADVREIGRRLAVALVLDGSVQRGGARMRITLRLVRVADGVTVWARAFDVNSEDPIAAQERIATAVVNELRTRFETPATAPIP
jgi:TolB-like protein